MPALAIEFLSTTDTPPCPECDRSTHCVRGSVLWFDEKRAEYTVALHKGEEHQGSHWLFVFAEDWTCDGPYADSEAALLYFGSVQGTVGFSISDADGAFARAIAPKATLLPRSRVAGTEFAREIFEVADLSWESDDRIEAIRSWANLK